MGSQTALAPISLGASISDIVRTLEAHCDLEEIDELVSVSIAPCTDLLRRLTPTFLSEMHIELQEAATSRALLVEQCSHRILGLQSRIMACRVGLSVHHHSRLVSWAGRSTSSFLGAPQQAMEAREAELADLVVELEAAFDFYSQCTEGYEAAVGEVFGLMDSALALRTEAEAHLRDIRDFISSFE